MYKVISVFEILGADEGRNVSGVAKTLECVRQNCVVPEGTQVDFPLYPGLTPWAKTNSAPAGLIFSHSIHRGKRNIALTQTL